MMDPLSIGIVGASTLAGLGLATFAGLRGWTNWIDYKRLELATRGGDPDLPPAGGRIEIADLRERVRKLEAIAEGIDL
ncbi:hypothetical protein [Sphingomicrobium nitratireducens]|uniref:hypothetical protein n=1 Tax=Sphingomicrobium nitratireducens TaxID=2964666 RepID=UPI00223FFC63|nr:hypothetical protein [Sphingomicrobium nitratireducens]